MRIIIFTLIITSLHCACSSGENDSAPPNIVVFLVDDMGWQDTSVPFHTQVTDFNRRYHTPAMEKLASMGSIFTQAYSNSVCTPTRVSLITGMNAARHGVTNWTLRKGGAQEPRHPFLSHHEWNVNGLSPVPDIPQSIYATTLPQVLKEAGYYTVHIGKAHFGAMDTPGADPLNLGFEQNIGGHAAGAPGSYEGVDSFKNTRNPVWNVPDLEAYHGQDIFLTEALTREAIRLLENTPEDQPFFLYMSHYAVHTPIMADKRFMDKYLESGLDEKEASYSSMVEGMDKSLGDILQWLTDHGKMENTIILFTSDNGGLSAVARGGEKHTHNKPLSSGKGSAHEGGIREPMIVYWPGRSAPGSRIDTPVIIEDFFPTILEMAGVDNYSTQQVIDGQSFTGLLKGDPGDKSRPLYWHYPNTWGASGPGIGASSTIRKGDWKLIYYHDSSNFELFNLKEDIGEFQNRAATHKNMVDSLARQLGEYLRSVNATMPFDQSKNRQVPWPDEIQP